MIIVVFFDLLDLHMFLTTLPKRMVFQYIAAKKVSISYLNKFLVLFEPSGSFLILDSRHPEIQKCPRIGYFGPISRYGAFFPLNFCQGTWFQCKISKSHHSLKLPEIFWNSGNYLELVFFNPILMYGASIQLYFCHWT